MIQITQPNNKTISEHKQYMTFINSETQNISILNFQQYMSVCSQITNSNNLIDMQFGLTEGNILEYKKSMRFLMSNEFKNILGIVLTTKIIK